MAGNNSVLIQENAGLGNATIVRTRGMLDVRPQAFSADISVIGAVGFGIVSDEAFAAGAAGVPGPWTNSDWSGWFVWQAFSYLYDMTTDVGRLVLPSSQFDSKAMRKVGINETVVVVCESQADAVNISIPFRMLVKLP